MDPNAVAETFRRTVTEHYLDFQGRCARRDFWYYVLAYFVIYIGLAVIQAVIGTRALTGLFGLALLLPGLGISVRRLHDTDRSGWWILIGVVPLFLMILLGAAALAGGSAGPVILSAVLLPILTLAAMALLIYWYAQTGTSGDNSYGPPPAQIAPDSTAHA